MDFSVYEGSCVNSMQNDVSSWLEFDLLLLWHVDDVTNLLILTKSSSLPCYRSTRDVMKSNDVTDT
jgi:Uri superfamily endonuclease